MPRPKLGSPMSVQLHPDDDSMVRQIVASGDGEANNNSGVVRGLVQEAFLNRRAKARDGQQGEQVNGVPSGEGRGFSQSELEMAVARLSAQIAPALSCEEVAASITDYLADELDVETNIAFNLHARQCHACNSLLTGDAPASFVLESIAAAAAPELEELRR